MRKKDFVFYFNGHEFKSVSAAWESVKDVPGIISLSTFIKEKPSTLKDAMNKRKHGYTFNGVDFASMTDAWKSIEDEPCRVSFSTFYACRPTTTEEATFKIYSSADEQKHGNPNKKTIRNNPNQAKKIIPSPENVHAAKYILDQIPLINTDTGNPELASALANLKKAAEQEIENYKFHSGR